MAAFARVAAAVPPCRVADVDFNVSQTVDLWQRADAEGCHVVVFPELGTTSYTARDLLLDDGLLHACDVALTQLCVASRALKTLALIGMPMRTPHGLYNVAVAICAGQVLAVIPKSYLPNYREFEERRWFRPGTEVAAGAVVTCGGVSVPFGTDIVLDCTTLSGLCIAAEICEDLWVQVPPHVRAVGAGATVVANLSASNFAVGKADLRRLLVNSASDRGKCAYIYVAAGPGESSTDLAFDADAFISENGHIIAHSERFSRAAQLIAVDVDLDVLQHDRRTTGTFGDCALHEAVPMRRIAFASHGANATLLRTIDPHPFVPRDPAMLATRTREIFEVQTHALATRLLSLGPSTKLVLGLSGGLDSTQAALVCAGALDLLGRPRSDLVALTMPGFGTTAGTKSSALLLGEALGADISVVSIGEAARTVLHDVGHAAADGVVDVEGLLGRLRADPSLGDITLENVQARMRTLVLMTKANQVGGIVVGTGDLSEKALGWSTYNGDHMSMYDVNAGVPKTLIQFVVRYVATARAEHWAERGGDAQQLKQVLFAILDTPISPELLPADASGQIQQLTESVLGPYELHDFFLFHMVRHGRRPARILQLANAAFGTSYPTAELKRRLQMFYKRFFTSQFKRSATPDAPKVGMVSLSPRGDWRMPSDADVSGWLADLDEAP